MNDEPLETSFLQYSDLVREDNRGLRKPPTVIRSDLRPLILLSADVVLLDLSTGRLLKLLRALKNVS